MKKTLVVIGLVALMALMGSAVFAVDDGDDTIGIKVEIPTVKILAISDATLNFEADAPETAGTDFAAIIAQTTDLAMTLNQAAAETYKISASTTAVPTGVTIKLTADEDVPGTPSSELTLSTESQVLVAAIDANCDTYENGLSFLVAVDHTAKRDAGSTALATVTLTLATTP